jgi:hypothetical protein
LALTVTPRYSIAFLWDHSVAPAAENLEKADGIIVTVRANRREGREPRNRTDVALDAPLFVNLLKKLCLEGKMIIWSCTTNPRPARIHSVYGVKYNVI